MTRKTSHNIGLAECSVFGIDGEIYEREFPEHILNYKQKFNT